MSDDIESTFCFEKKSKNIITLNNSVKCDDVEPKKRFGKPNAKSPFARKCFNCDQTGHNLQECKTPRNYAKIESERARFQFFASLSASGDSINKRYQKAEEDTATTNNRKFSAGSLGSKIRSALDIRHKDIPLHVYKMRIFGYPPGWLEEAKLEDVSDAKSNLSIFGNVSGDDADGDSGSAAGNSNTEPDECSYKKSDIKLSIDPHKIISYEGFNKPIREGVKDLHHRYKCPKLSKNQSKSNFIHSFSVASRKKRALSPTKKPSRKKKRKSHNGKLVVIDIADGGESNDSSKSDSPSIIELTNQKNELMKLLKAENGEPPNESGDESLSESGLLNELDHSIESQQPTLLDRGIKIPKEENFTGDMVWIVSHTDPSTTTDFRERLKKLQTKNK